MNDMRGYCGFLDFSGARIFQWYRLCFLYGMIVIMGFIPVIGRFFLELIDYGIELSGACGV